MRRAMVLAAIGTVTLVPSVEARASGGGGCGAPVTQETGDAVAIREFCFEPTVLVVPGPGQVTFTNQDGFPHNVLGANGSWGSFARMNGGKVRTHTFDQPGVYPYVCTWHPGMVGTVVVGDALAGQDLDAATAGLASGRTQAEAQATSNGWKIAAIAAGGLLALIAIGTAGLRRRLREDQRV